MQRYGLRVCLLGLCLLVLVPAGLFAFGLAGGPAAAQDGSRFGLSDTDRIAIRNVISRQVAAFRHDDGDAAFAFAAPGIKQRFGTADTFMHMVRAGYQAVYRPQRFEFLDIVDLNGEPAQRVYVIGPDGNPAIALYAMQRQSDGTWLIAGCYLIEMPGETA